jgi:DNA-binding YbaB/EbfC family protein
VSDAKFDLRAVMAQAQEMTEKLRRVQEELRHRTVSTTVGGGMVEVTANGALEIVKVVIDPRAVDPRDVEMLQDLVAAAVNAAIANAQRMVQEEMQRAAATLQAPAGSREWTISGLGDTPARGSGGPGGGA